ncbi:hypothetical protein BH92_07300 [Rhodococcoides fascians A21d2]|uniref:hypothetical protein n=2 Tax=Nocardiaceae TaxID=85025 RepID=UPI000AC714DB|nr:hypothetical protein [Rhodococcus fascians]OZF36545.1 hypothetical protein CH296_05425 [Rhodococcus sp. 14-2496-1d]QIH99699.1 hypothetical protein BH92_07300 [Rhodococcus fascians A21d2]
MAKLHNTTAAEMARKLIIDGLELMLDPAEITAAIEKEKERLLNAAKQMSSKRMASPPKSDAVETVDTTEASATSSVTEKTPGQTAKKTKT